MWWMVAGALAGPVEPAWSGRLAEAPADRGVQLMGVDPAGELGWVQVHHDGARALWQVDLRRGRVDGAWRGEAGDPRLGLRWGALYPLVQTPTELQRLLLVQGHIAGLGRWSDLAVAPQGPWAAWERPTPDGGDGLGLRGPTGDVALATDLYAAYRPRFDRAGGRVAFTGTGRPTRYRLFVHELRSGQRRDIEGLGHSSWYEWDGRDRLWALADISSAEGVRSDCLSVVDGVHARQVVCADAPADTSMALMDPSGELLVVAWYEGQGVSTTLKVVAVRTRDEEVVARTTVPTGRTLQALRQDGCLLVGTLEGSEVVDLTDGRRAPLPDHLAAPLAIHWVEGRLPMLHHRAWTREVAVVWVDPDEALDAADRRGASRERELRR